jgi:hypothetical protein
MDTNRSEFLQPTDFIGEITLLDDDHHPAAHISWLEKHNRRRKPIRNSAEMKINAEDRC